MSAVATPDRDSAVQRLPRLGYIPALDGLRALAVVAVLLYHGDAKWMPGGFLGVDVFFVISGYLITCLLLGDWRQFHAIQFGRFYLRRARRLLPALFLMLGVVALFSVLFVPDTLDELRGQVFAAIAYIENWWLTFHDVSYFVAAGRPPLLRHLWSLAVEEQFYLFWPLLLAFILRYWGADRRKVFGIVAGLAVLSAILMAVLYQPYHDPSRVYFGTDTRASTMLVGACLAFVWSPWRLTRDTARSAPMVLDGFAAVGLVGVLWFFLNASEFDPWMYRGGFTVLALFTALLLAGTVHPASRLAPAVFGFTLFRWIGVRSYGIYLWHWPIYMVTRPHADVPLTGIPLLLLRLGLTVGAATLSFKYVEEPIRAGAIGRQLALYRRARGEQRTNMTRRLGVVSGVVVLSLVVIVFGLGAGGTPGRPNGLPAVAATVLKPPDTTVDPAATTTTTLVPSAAPYRVLAIGDSVMLGAAQQLADAINPVKPIQVDAAQNRQFFQGVDDIQTYADDGLLPNDDVVVHLGTNGLVDPADFDHMMDILANVRKVLILTAKAPRPWEDEVNDTIRTEAKKYKNAVIIDWHTIGGAHPEFFYDDEIHLRPDGADFYANLVKSNL
ncbi:MAG: acyltransferase family protein [Acidimicrobiia bacterium]